MSQSTPILEFVGVSKHFGGIHALENVSFAVPKGGIHALVGENGAGKSTLIRICGGVYPPDAGRLCFDGKDVSFQNALEARTAGISIVHQEIPICPHLTAAENIFLGRELPRRRGLIDWHEVNRQAKLVFDRLQTDIRPSELAGKLPIARQQLVEIAQALSIKSKVLIMDEPTSALGKQETDRLFEIIRQLKDEGITIIYVSHRLEEVFELADTITVLRDGHYIGTVDRVGCTAETVVQMMVGREIDNLFPKAFVKAQETPLLSVRNLTVPGVFENVSFDLHGGEVLGLVGLQGSGTSEVMRALFGQYKNLAGEVRVGGKPVQLKSSLDSIRHGIAYVPADRQAEGLFKTLSVRDNAGILKLPAISNALGWISRRQLIQQAVQSVRELSIKTATIDSPITSLSGGNQQKVVIAKSLSVNPPIILLDDPTRGIDVGAKAEIHHILNRLTAQGCGILLVSSELPEVLAMSDRLVVMYRGQMRALLSHAEADRDRVMGLATGVTVQANGQSQPVH